MVSKREVTKWQLFSSLCSTATHKVTLVLDGVRGTIAAIDREDGSGSSFNVRLLAVNSDGKMESLTVYVRTID